MLPRANVNCVVSFRIFTMIELRCLAQTQPWPFGYQQNRHVFSYRDVLWRDPIEKLYFRPKWEASIKSDSSAHRCYASSYKKSSAADIKTNIAGVQAIAIAFQLHRLLALRGKPKLFIFLPHVFDDLVIHLQLLAQRAQPLGGALGNVDHQLICDLGKLFNQTI